MNLNVENPWKCLADVKQPQEDISEQTHENAQGALQKRKAGRQEQSQIEQ